MEGVVQGVGFRPFIHGLATGLGLAGSVANDTRGVRIEVEGDTGSLERFVEAVRRQAPPLAVVERLTVESLAARDDVGFVILPSEQARTRSALVSPDVATCAECLREILDPRERRYRYAFTNCTRCGPRFTIARDVPYDRATTTMAEFPMCAACAREYDDPGDRRFHAQPIACPACGPRLVLLGRDGCATPGDPLGGAARALRAGAVVAVKSLGGYHLAVVASDERAVAALRARKHREEKPFALMVADLPQARALATLAAADEELLSGGQRPIVLVPRRPDARVAAGVAPGNRALGLMLPFTPLHHLLLGDVGVPLVLTSGNVSDEPIVYRDADAITRLAHIADLWLTHDRPIHVRVDDSVMRSFRGGPLPVRRARGYAPQPVTLPWELPLPVLACGAELKSTVCVARGRHAFLSQHLGDLENYEAFRAFVEAAAHLRRLFDVEPAVIAHDLHPEYLSTKWALEQPGRVVGVQHHHAHVAACLADNGETGPAIGVAFDGLGYGADGTLWGGEFLVADLASFARAGHLAAVPLPGGVAAIREPWRMAVAYLHAAFDGSPPPLAVLARQGECARPVRDLMTAPEHAPATTSAGRLFDAVAAMLGVRDRVTYEGQAAIELEQIADEAPAAPYPASIRRREGAFEIVGADVVRAVAEDLLDGVAAGPIAARFHESVARLILDGCRLARERSALTTVALSGGVFQNVRLLVRAGELLAADGFRVLRHRRVPPNDGGISLGQAVVAARRPA